MQKTFGTTARHDALIPLNSRRAVLIYGYGEEGGMGYDYRHTFDHLPTPTEVLKVITDHVNTLTDEKILSGFQWNGKPVWLSAENQFNFKAAYDLAVQTGGATLPATFKLGDDPATAIPAYHTFTTLEELQDFYVHAILYIQQTLNDGWAQKDAAAQWVATVIPQDTSPKTATYFSHQRIEVTHPLPFLALQHMRIDQCVFQVGMPENALQAKSIVCA